MLSIGKKAENFAITYLQRQAFTIRARNFRVGKAEIDVIAERAGVLVFIEVKMRSAIRFGYAETFVTAAQQTRYRTAVENYLSSYPWSGPIRFDIIALHKQRGGYELLHLTDAF